MNSARIMNIGIGFCNRARQAEHHPIDLPARAATTCGARRRQPACRQ
jgi:hypothetical protein